MKVLFSLNRIIHGLSAILMGVMLTLVLVQVFFRYVLSSPLLGSEELARYSMVWLVMLGATVLLRTDGNVSVTYFAERFPESIQKVIRIVVQLLIGVFYIILTVYGYEVAKDAMSQISPATGIPVGYIAGSFPISGVIGILYIIENIILEIVNKAPQMNSQ